MNDMQKDGTAVRPVDQVDQINLIDILIVLAKHKTLIIGAPIITALLVGIGSYAIPNQYTSTLQLLPPQSQGASGMLGQLGALSGLTGGALAMKPNDMYVGILTSRTVGDKLIKRFNLQAAYNAASMTSTRERLQKATVVSSGKNGLIAIEVTDHDPKRAADLANGYADELLALTNTLAITEASQRRLFFEKQLHQAKLALAEAEVALKSVQEKTGLIQLSGQAEAIIRAAADLKAQIASKVVALGVMRSFSTSSNPEVVRTQQELAGLRAELSKLETGMNRGKGDVLIASSQVPAAGLDYVRKAREVKYQETIFEMLAKQFELAKIDEAKEGAVLQVLDRAIPAEVKTKPNRGMLIVLSALFAGVAAVLWAFMREAAANMALDRRQAARMETLRSCFRRK